MFYISMIENNAVRDYLSREGAGGSLWTGTVSMFHNETSATFLR